MLQNSLQYLSFLCGSVPVQIRRLVDEALHEASAQLVKKEITGHLCDSAFTILDRMVRRRLEYTPQICYDQDSWVSVHKYQAYNVDYHLSLWSNLNRHFYQITQALTTEVLKRVCIDSEANKVSLEFQVEDYVRFTISLKAILA